MYTEAEVLNLLDQWIAYSIDIELDILEDKFPNKLSYYEWF